MPVTRRSWLGVSPTAAGPAAGVAARMAEDAAPELGVEPGSLGEAGEYVAGAAYRQAATLAVEEPRRRLRNRPTSALGEPGVDHHPNVGAKPHLTERSPSPARTTNRPRPVDTRMSSRSRPTVSPMRRPA